MTTYTETMEERTEPSPPRTHHRCGLGHDHETLDARAACDGYTRSRNCGETCRHGEHLWPELVGNIPLTRHCWGNIVVPAGPDGFGKVTRDEEGLFDGGAGPYDFDDESGGFR